MTTLVEGFAPDAVALARHLAAAGEAVRLAGPGPAPPDARALVAHGVAVEPNTDLDAVPGPADTAYLDVWTPEVAPRVARLRAQGTRVTTLGELVLEQAAGPTLAVTGTAGKTTTAHLAVQLLRAAGLPVDASTTGRAGNLWPTAELLDRAEPTRLLVLELTSSHLCFMQRSPQIAVVTCFWPDHLELHGSLPAYRAAKETIVRHQRPGDRVVVNADDAAAGSFAALTPADAFHFSLQRPVERGVFVAPGGAVTIRADDGDHPAGSVDDLPAAGPQRANVLAALAAALAAGASPQALAGALAGVEPPPFRASPAGSLAGVPVVDDGMAATPTKAAASLGGYPDGSVILIAGGEDVLESGPVHASRAEQQLLERACDEIARAARLAVLFGPAAAALVPRLRERGVAVEVAPTLDAALARAAVRAAGAAAIVFSPLYPVSLHDRQRFAALVG